MKVTRVRCIADGYMSQRWVTRTVTLLQLFFTLSVKAGLRWVKVTPILGDAIGPRAPEFGFQATAIAVAMHQQQVDLG